jgi:hypothetical protein
MSLWAVFGAYNILLIEIPVASILQGRFSKVIWIKSQSPSHEPLKSSDDTRAIAESLIRKTESNLHNFVIRHRG